MKPQLCFPIIKLIVLLQSSWNVLVKRCGHKCAHREGNLNKIDENPANTPTNTFGDIKKSSAWKAYPRVINKKGHLPFNLLGFF